MVPKSHQRLLKLMDILQNETDEQHELSIEEIQDKLKMHLDIDDAYDVRSIKRDLEALDQHGFGVVTNKGKYNKNLYSHHERLFETYQLRLIVDAVLSARFITAKDKDALIKNIQQLTSKHEAKKLPNTIIFNPTTTLDYQQVKVNIDHIHDAISNQLQITYQYGMYNVKKEFELRHDGGWYIVEPYALIWQNDYYYLIARYLPTDELRHYRLDRMRNINVTDEKFKRQPFDMTEYIEQSFHMFAGKERRIKLKFNRDLIGIVIDRFGLEADIQALDEDYILLNTKAKVSNGLISWILRWGSGVTVVSPQALKEKVVAEITAMQKNYES